MVIRNPNPFPCVHSMLSEPQVDWFTLHFLRYLKSQDPSREEQQGGQQSFPMGQQEPRSALPCREPPRSGVGRRGEREEETETVQNKSLWKRKTYPVSHTRDMPSSTRTDSVDTDWSKLTESGHSFILVTDSESDFPPIPDCSQLRSSEQTGGVVMSPTLMKTFAQVVSQESISDDAKLNCCEEAECVPKANLKSDSGSSAQSCEENSIDTSDHRYTVLMEFATKCGYSERDVEKVINKCGLDCEKNLMLQELIRNSSDSEHVNCPDDLSSGSEPQMESQNESRVEGLPVFGDDDHDDADDDVEEEKRLEQTENSSNNLRDIVIDGSNVAMSHGKTVFSCRGIQLAVDWFRERGHRNIVVFVPQWRKETPRPDSPMTDQHLLLKLAEEGIVVFTPARRVKGRRVVCYDDRYVLKEAVHSQGVVVSNDNYRDLIKESQDFRQVVDERLLMYTFVNDRFMPPEDPLGRTGPTLDNFLRKQPRGGQMKLECPYGRKCTFGNKCKYSHPERGTQPHRTVSEALKERTNKRVQDRKAETLEQKKTSGEKSKLARTRSLVPTEHVSVEKSSGSLSQTPHESFTDVESCSRSPPSSGARTSNYLREHRKKLEKDLAMASLAELRMNSENTALFNVWGSNNVNQHQAGFGGGSACSHLPYPSPHQVSSPTHSKEGHLVSGHLLMAKKLSDEASDFTFFAQGDLKPYSNKPGPHVSQHGFSSGKEDIYDNRRSSFPSSQHPHQHLYRHSPPTPQHTNFGTGNSCRCTGQMPQAVQNSYPCDQSMAPTAAFHSYHTSSAGTHLQNSFSDQQVYTSSSPDASYRPRFSPYLSPSLQPSPDRSFPAHAGQSHHQEQYQHSSPHQASTFQHVPSPHAQITQGQSFSNSCTAPVTSTVWGGRQTYPNQTFTTSPYPQLPCSSPPPPTFNTPVGPTPSSWATPPPMVSPSTQYPRLPPSNQPPVIPSSTQSGFRDSSHPMAVTDPRYPLFVQLCDVFAQPVVQAVMAKFPEERDLHNLRVHIINELCGQMQQLHTE